MRLPPSSDSSTSTSTTTARSRRRRRPRPRTSSHSSSSHSSSHSSSSTTSSSSTLRLLTAASSLMTTTNSAAAQLLHDAFLMPPLSSSPFSASSFHNDNDKESRFQKQDVDVTKLSTSCISLEYISIPMNDADVDSNGFLSKDEYVSFANAISGGYLNEKGWDDAFTDMPLSLQETYLVLSCLCELYPNQPWGGKGCCEASSSSNNNNNNDGGSSTDEVGIRTAGTGDGERPTKQERQYLTYVCGTMDESLGSVGSSSGLVAPPSSSPTDFPTVIPTKRPTDTPTPRPTNKPTREPTSEPTGEPTTTPTERPTRRPQSERPTPEPTATPKPTSRPSSRSPTPSPTRRPVVDAGPPATPFPTEPTTTTTDASSALPSGGPSRSSPSGTPTNVVVPSGAPDIDAGGGDSSFPSTIPSRSPTFAGETPAAVDFVQNLLGRVDAADVMAGENNQVKVMMEEQLLVLSEEVIREEFRPLEDGRGSKTRGPSVSDGGGSDNRRRGLRRGTHDGKGGGGSGGGVDVREEGRELIVREATSALVDSAEDVVCPPGTPGVDDPTTEEECVLFNSTILLSMIDEPDVDGKVATFQSAMLAKIDEGWLFDNLDLYEALMSPPTTPMPTPPPVPPTPFRNPDPSNGNAPLEPDPKLSAGAIVGMVIFGLAFFLLAALYARRRMDKDNDSDIGRSPRGNLQEDELDGESRGRNNSAFPDNDVSTLGDDATVNTDARSYSSRDHLLTSGGKSSRNSAAMFSSPLPELRETEERSSRDVMDGNHHNRGADPLEAADRRAERGAAALEADSEVEGSIFSESEDLTVDDDDDERNVAAVRASGSANSQIAALAAASTLVASQHPYVRGEDPSPGGETEMSSIGQESSVDPSFEAEGFAGAVGAGGDARAAPQAAAAMGGGSGGGAPAAGAAAGGGLATGAAAAVGAAAAGVVAVGAYAATRPSEDNASRSSADTSSITSAASRGMSPRSSAPPNAASAMEDLDNAIDSGNWGHVGALAAVLASQGHGSHRRPNQADRAALDTRSEGWDGDSRSSHASADGGDDNVALDRSRAVEIDGLVESGDWQGVVLAAARFEADQTFDGESSFSASGVSSNSSRTSSRWTGSATSATTPRSMATTDRTSASNLSSQRGQAEIRAEVEALVRRVVPEEADNIDEMMTQFKGREEELVETLRRMQERAIASRARLAVQKSAKLEAKAKAKPARSVSSSQRSSGGGSGAGNDDAADAASSSGRSATSVGSTKSELELAIESGNWQAVGAAAQRMSDMSVGELSTGEVTRLREVISASPAFNRGNAASRGSLDGDLDLDALIEAGDWTGVIAAAKSASEDRLGAQKGGVGGGRQGAGGGGDEQGDRSRSMMEEQDALAQANMWQEIADQSKPEARQGPAGATDAAAWAIQRSLQAMDSPDLANTTGDTSAGGSKASRTIQDIADDNETSGEYSQYESSSFEGSEGRSWDGNVGTGI